MDIDLLKEIIATYRKYEWNLLKILVSNGTTTDVTHKLEAVYENDAEICNSEMDAAWFTRPSKKDREAFELRLIDENPFALFETFPKDIDQTERENMLKDMETRLAEISSGKTS